MTSATKTTSPTGHRCTDCDHVSHQWFGRCPGCGAWGSAAAFSAAGDLGAVEVTTLSHAARTVARLPVGIGELDRVLGGGFVPGAVVLLAGEPGVGKSTLVLQLLDSLNERGHRTLLVTGEESLDQVSLRAARLGVDRQRFRAATSTAPAALIEAADRERPEVLVVDSIQTLEDPALEQAAGSTVQVRECAAALVRYAKSSATTVVLVGHVTKDGAVAGPKTLEHVVDAVVTLEGDRAGELRLLRAAKNRFGSCDETGVFVMRERGLEEVADPSAMLLADRRARVAGSVVFPDLEGSRTVLVELQALVTGSQLPQPRRVALGVDARKLSLLLGVLAERMKLKLAERDVFVAAAGGLAIREPAADLALCVALCSAADQHPVDPGLVAIGEVGLGGEIRRVPGIDRRLREGARLGFDAALVPRGTVANACGLRLIEADDIRGALAVAVA